MRAHHEQKLEQELISVRKIARNAEGEMPKAVLPADLAELAGPVGKDTGKAGIGQISMGGAGAADEASGDGRAAIDSIFGGGEHAEGMLGLENADGRKLIAGAPEKLGAEEEIFIDGAAQGFPAECGVRAVEIGEEIRAEIRAEIAMAARIGDAEIEVGGLAEVAIDAQVTDDADILAAIGGVDGGGIAAEDLGGAFREPVFRGGQEVADGNAGVVDCGFSNDQAICCER